MASSASTAAKDIATIAAYHAHVYYDPATTRGAAERVRAGLAARFPDARLGRWHDAPVGPHPRAIILFVLRTGLPWEYLPAEMGCGSGMTCWRRLRDWQQAGVWAALHRAVLERLEGAGYLDWSRAALDWRPDSNQNQA
jgi:transposase